MNPTGLPTEHSNTPLHSFSRVNAGTDASIPGWRRYVHLYAPLATSILINLYTQSVAPTSDSDNSALLAILSVLPTYFIGSLVYPAHRPELTSDQSVRFTRKNSLYRVGVLATYGRLFGTRFNLLFFIADVALSFGADHLVGERPVGTEQRRSEFLVALLWVLGSQGLSFIIPYNTPTIGTIVGTIDRTLWRTAYIALIDNVVGLLARPNVHTFRGKATLILVQAVTIVSIVYLGFNRRRRMHERIKVQVSKKSEPDANVET